MGLIQDLKISIYKIKWRKHNKHNGTFPVTLFDESAVKIGNMTYGELYVLSYGQQGMLKIGNYCSIAPKVAFILSADHYTNHISSFPFKVKVSGTAKFEGVSKGDIIVDDDVWIGYGATIMSGVHIGQGAIIAAGAVVTKDVPSYAIVGGVPAKVIKYRFSEEIIRELINVDYRKLTKEMIEEHIEDLYVELKDSNQLDWMPKRVE